MDISLIENHIDISYLDQYAAIIGECPSKGARSPKLWNAVFESEKRNCKMLPLDVKKENIINLLNNLNNDKEFIGGAIAVPYKEVVAKWLGDNVTPEAKNIGAVNCLFRDSDGLLHGTNTDGEASLKVFKDKFGIIKDKSVLILGLGGAGKAVSSYFSATFKNTVVISRHESGEQFANKIGSEWASWNGVEKLVSNADIIINCTSLGFEGQELKSPLNIQQISKIRKSTIVFDIIYQPIKTKLLKMAEAKGITIINGLEMNLEQAVIAFKYCNNGSSEKIRALMKVVS